MTPLSAARAREADTLAHGPPVCILRRIVDREYISGVIPWSCPVLSFGDYETARIASVGLNPSSREFVDDRGRELIGSQRRFHTLASLGLDRWADATHGQLTSAWNRCRSYFAHRPYDAWFRQLEYVIGETGASYYGHAEANACHLDVIPYATWRKWAELTSRDKTRLLRSCEAVLGTQVKNSPIQVLILNGRSVASFVERLSGVTFATSAVPRWSVRSGARKVEGIAFRGTVTQLGGVALGRTVVVLGYNHNLQSSFGITREVRTAIRRWIGRAVQEILP